MINIFSLKYWLIYSVVVGISAYGIKFGECFDKNPLLFFQTEIHIFRVNEYNCPHVNNVSLSKKIAFIVVKSPIT